MQLPNCHVVFQALQCCIPSTLLGPSWQSPCLFPNVLEKQHILSLPLPLAEAVDVVLVRHAVGQDTEQNSLQCRDS